MLFSVSMVTVGDSESQIDPVAEGVQRFADAGLACQVSGMSTVVEGGEAAAVHGTGRPAFAGGIFACFFGFLLRFLRLHQHVHRAQNERRTAPIAVLNLVGDAVHNFSHPANAGCHTISPCGHGRQACSALKVRS